MDLARKLQIKEGQRLAVLDLPDGVDLGVEAAPDGDAILGFVRMRADLPRMAPVLEAARQDRLAWIAYPKAGGLGTDLDRDSLWALLKDEGVRPVRQVAIDATWSALRFRPA